MFRKLGRVLTGGTALFAFFVSDVGQVEAAGGSGVNCDPGSPSVNLENCYYLKDNIPVSVVYNNPGSLINLLVSNLFVIAGIIIFFLMLYAGFQFITGGTKGAEKAKTTGETAAIGFIIMFSAYWILQIIKILTGANILIP